MTAKRLVIPEFERSGKIVSRVEMTKNEMTLVLAELLSELRFNQMIDSLKYQELTDKGLDFFEYHEWVKTTMSEGNENFEILRHYWKMTETMFDNISRGVAVFSGVKADNDDVLNVILKEDTIFALMDEQILAEIYLKTRSGLLRCHLAQFEQKFLARGKMKSNLQLMTEEINITCNLLEKAFPNWETEFPLHPLYYFEKLLEIRKNEKSEFFDKLHQIYKDYKSILMKIMKLKSSNRLSEDQLAKLKTEISEYEHLNVK
jgi:hypothetical protein